MGMEAITRSKIKGMLVGGAIGDALGAPVEMWNPEKIAEVHGGPVTKYVPPIGHKWFKVEEFLPGMTTDDTQLTIATMEGLIKGHDKAKSGDFDAYMDAIAAEHVEEMKRMIGGWGTTTQEAVRRIANGVSWKQSGKTSEPNRGTGNGVPMKCSPLGAWLACPVGRGYEEIDETFHFNQRCVDFSAMTHWTQISAHAGVVHANLIYMCLWEKPGHIVPKYVIDLIADVIPNEYWDSKDVHIERYDVSHLDACNDDLFEALAGIKIYKLKKMTVEDIAEQHGCGCYVFESLPFSYAIWLRNLHSMDGIIEAANAGGDNDTNAKIVGELLGANDGIEIFQRPENRWAIDGLKDYDKLIDLAERFCDKFDIK